MNQRRPFKKPFAQEKSRNPERDFSPRKHNGEETTDLGSEKFSSLMREVAGEMGLKDQLDLEPAPLATLDYEKELELKNATLRKFWELHNLPDKPSLVVPSPLPRHYRSTSKRRLYRKGPSWKWEERVGGGKSREDAGILEPAEHAAIYKQALEKLNEEPYRNLANSLNFLILRGAPELMVIFNVFRLNADVVRKAKLLTEHLAQRSENKVAAAHLFYDATRSSYYIEARVSPGPFRVKRLFGPEFLPIEVEGIRYFLHPTGFFQVNPSILPRVLEEVQNALKPQKGDRFLDLFCGCGLFTVPVARFCQTAWGVEGSSVACDSARQSAGLQKIRNTHFVAGKLEAKHLPKLLPRQDGNPEILLLDPPRQGTEIGLINALAERKPRRIVQLFCGMDVMPMEIGRWRKQGYMVAKVLPFDMFPGTANLEVMVVLLPDKYGLLNRKPPGRSISENDQGPLFRPMQSSSPGKGFLRRQAMKKNQRRR
jgi:tRNA/tmRNA/rRNA uracil-C5-methylase (TrmA/RlmC/RlmD family)